MNNKMILKIQQKKKYLHIVCFKNYESLKITFDKLFAKKKTIFILFHIGMQENNIRKNVLEMTHRTLQEINIRNKMASFYTNTL